MRSFVSALCLLAAAAWGQVPTQTPMAGCSDPSNAQVVGATATQIDWTQPNAAAVYYWMLYRNGVLWQTVIKTSATLTDHWSVLLTNPAPPASVLTLTACGIGAAQTPPTWFGDPTPTPPATVVVTATNSPVRTVTASSTPVRTATVSIEDRPASMRQTASVSKGIRGPRRSASLSVAG